MHQFIKLPNGSYVRVNACPKSLKRMTNKCFATETKEVCPQEFQKGSEFSWARQRGSCSLRRAWEQSRVGEGQRGSYGWRGCVTPQGGLSPARPRPPAAADRSARTETQSFAASGQRVRAQQAARHLSGGCGSRTRPRAHTAWRTQELKKQSEWLGGRGGREAEHTRCSEPGHRPRAPPSSPGTRKGPPPRPPSSGAGT